MRAFQVRRAQATPITRRHNRAQELAREIGYGLPVRLLLGLRFYQRKTGKYVPVELGYVIEGRAESVGYVRKRIKQLMCELDRAVVPETESELAKQPSVEPRSV